VPDVYEQPLKHRLRQIETDECCGHRTISVMKGAYPSYDTAVPEMKDVHLIKTQGGRTGFKLNQGRSLLDLGEY